MPKPFATNCCERGPVLWRRKTSGGASRAILKRAEAGALHRPPTWIRSGPAGGTSGSSKSKSTSRRPPRSGRWSRAPLPPPKPMRSPALPCFAGLRASASCAGCAWAHLELGNNPKVTIEERADENNVLGVPKSDASKRMDWPQRDDRGRLSESLEGPATAVVITKDGDGNKISRPRKLVFGTATDRPGRFGQHPTSAARACLDQGRRGAAAARCRRGAGGRTGKGNPVMQPKYTGPHCLRHFAISSWLRTCGGDFKAVQTRAGHATLALTLVTYGHLLDGRDGDQIAAAGRKLVLGWKLDATQMQRARGKIEADPR